MRLFLVLMGVVLTFSGCLKKLEDVTENTRDQVKESVQAVRDTHNGHKFSTALDTFFKTQDAASRGAAGESVILLADIDRLPLYLGMARPPEFDNVTRHTPNVSWVGTEDGDKDPDNYNDDLMIRAVRPSTIHAFISSCLGGLTFLKGAAFRAEPNWDEIDTKAKRAIPFCIGIFAARRLPAIDEADPKDIHKRSWPLTPKQQARIDKAIEKGEALIHEVLALPIFDDDEEFRAKSAHQIEVKMHNHLELADHDEDR